MNHLGLERQLCILSKQTIDSFLAEKNPAELISLYVFYYYTAKWQGTDKPEARTSYAATGLHWKEAKVRKAKAQLISLGLIEDFVRRNKQGKITGWYIHIKYIWKQETIDTTLPQNPEGGEPQRVEVKPPNALSALNKNASNVLATKSSTRGKKNVWEAAERVYEVYSELVRKGARTAAIKSIHKLLKFYSVDQLVGCVTNYSQTDMSPDVDFRIQANNFFGTKARFEDYLPQANSPADGMSIDESGEEDSATSTISETQRILKEKEL